ncbi:MAG: phage tail family protein [Planococcaceae bacterium]|nr:phage tail family protein [Planococcaceae bacterium]
MKLTVEQGRTAFLDDVEISEYGFQLESGHENPLLVNGTDIVTTIPGRAGQLFLDDTPGPIPFTLTTFTIQDNPFELQQKVRILKKLFTDSRGKKKYVKLRWAYEPDRFYFVRYNSDVPFERIFGKSGRASIPLICDDGFAQSVVKNDEVTWGSEVLTFASTAYTFGHTGSGVAAFLAPGTTSVEVVGDNVRPMVIVSGFGTNVTISWGGKTMTLGTFPESNWAIDLKEYVATKDGLNALDDIGGDWLTMELEPGTNVISVGGSGLDLEIAFVYSDIWFG